MIAKALIQVPQIRDNYIDISSKYYFVSLDGNQLLERTPVNLSRLFLASIKLTENITQDQVKIQEEISNEIKTLTVKGKLIIVFDHIQELNFPELKPFFIFLSNLTRIFAPKIVFIFVTTSSLVTPKQLENFGPLSHTITENIVANQLFNKYDALWFISEIEKQLGFKLENSQKEKIISLSGGMPRMIKRLAEFVKRGHNIEELEVNPNCDLTLSLLFSELLEYKNTNQNEIPILSSYLKTKCRGESKELFKNIMFNKRVTKNEEKVLRTLITNKNKIVSRENGIVAIWGENGLDVSDHAYDQIVHRLRSKLSDSETKVEIETVRGRGHVLKMA